MGKYVLDIKFINLTAMLLTWILQDQNDGNTHTFKDSNLYTMQG